VTEDMMEHEPLLEAERPVLALGMLAPDFTLQMPTGIQLSLANLLQNGPVLLNFIKGVWCPFCQRHLANLQKWKNSLIEKKVVIAVVSNEPILLIQQWLSTHPVNFLFGSVSDPAVFKSYGVDLKDHEFPRPATFLIDADGTVRFSYHKERNAKLEQHVQNVAV
jgi:peroxiredoxin